MEKPTFYVTTPIYYPNDNLHIGHAYTTVAADTLARYKRLRGYDVHFLTGTDENGQKLQRAAQEKGLTPQQFIDPIVAWIQGLWLRLDISYDDFIRTTQQRHVIGVQQLFQQLLDQDDIYLAAYQGWYCVPDESYWTQRQLIDGKCPDCGRPVEWVSEEAFFFRSSKYVEPLLAYYETHPDFITPESRKHEMINNFLKPGLEDLCVSRVNRGWGIPVPGHPEHVIYTWFDALANYITALGYGSTPDAPLMQRYWPADVHFMAKEIVRFHTIYWPMMLMALGLPLPKRVYAHGWLLMGGGKMSKSKGNVIDPKWLIDRYGSDAIRYYLLRAIPFGQDGNFTPEQLVSRINFDLANDLGNLLHRSLALVGRFFDGRVPQPMQTAPQDEELRSAVQRLPGEVERAMDAIAFNDALDAIWRVVRVANKYLDETAPWSHPQDQQRNATILYNILETLRVVATLLEPAMPKTKGRMLEQLGITESSALTWEEATAFGQLVPGRPTKPGAPLFPRLSIEEEVEAVARLVFPSSPAEKGEPEQQRAAAVAASSINKLDPIDVDLFNRVEIRVGQVVAAERIPKTDRLLKLQIDLGFEQRQVVSGIAEYFEPQALIGRRLLVVTNLKPVRLRGVDSYGMILAAKANGTMALPEVGTEVPLGTRVK